MTATYGRTVLRRPVCARIGGVLDDLGGRVERAVAAAGELRVAVSVRDLETGAHHAAGDDGEFGTASVVKVMIAARLLVEGRMCGEVERLARPMITGSDDVAANLLWEQTGAEGLEPWVEQHYGVTGLGSPNHIPGRWGNTHVTASGLTALFGALRNDPAVWPWLGPALHDVDPTATDGTDQVFGVLAVDPSAAVKQGWANGSSDVRGNAIVHSTGYVDHDRYAVAILTEGSGNVGESDARGFHAGMAAAVTRAAAALVD